MFAWINIGEMYLEPERLPNKTNMMHKQYDFFISTDEEYIILDKIYKLNLSIRMWAILVLENKIGAGANQ